MFSQLHLMHKIGRDNFSLGLQLLTATTSISQAIAEEAADYTRSLLRQSASACEQLADAKTIDARLDVQRDYGKAALEELFAHTEKMSDLYLTLANDSAKSLEAALERHPVDTIPTAPAMELSSTMSPGAGHATNTPERSVVRGVVANVVRETAQALRRDIPSA